MYSMLRDASPCSTKQHIMPFIPDRSLFIYTSGVIKLLIDAQREGGLSLAWDSRDSRVWSVVFSFPPRRQVWFSSNLQLPFPVLCSPIVMASPVSIGEDLVKLIKELKNRSDQVSALRTLPTILSLTSPIPVAEGKPEGTLLDHDRSHQLHHWTSGIETRLWWWLCTGIWRDLASHNPVGCSHNTPLINILTTLHFQVNYLV